jgi:DNA invertase Pin-like site-specific DNA recombinase
MADSQRAWMDGLDLRKTLAGQRRRRLTPEQIDEVGEALAKGVSPQELALKYGVTAHTIRRYKPA